MRRVLFVLVVLSFLVLPSADVIAQLPSTVVVNVATLNVRSGPSTEYSIVGRVYRGNTLTVIDADGAWYFICCTADGARGWVYGPYTRIPGPTPRLTPPTPAPAPLPVCDCSYNRYNCSYFATQRAAQACFNYCWQQRGFDVHWLDADNDRLACEWNP